MRDFLADSGQMAQPSKACGPRPMASRPLNCNYLQKKAFQRAASLP
jgi:hypothetical protein